MLCPCGSGDHYDECCGRFHRGEADAPTATLLMRSRYSAFAVRDAGYLTRTWHPSTRPRRLDLDPDREWTRLVILGSTGGGLLEPVGTVEFKAFYAGGSQHENSRFVRERGKWFYQGASARGTVQPSIR